MIRMAMCPGQGSQRVGMAADILKNFPYIKTIFEEAEDAISVNIRALCEHGPQETLNLTEFAQPCVLATSCAYGKILEEETGISFDYYAGHSLGEYSALVISHRLPLANAAQLVYLRGQAMQLAFPSHRASMIAVMGCDPKILIKQCAYISAANTEDGINVANWNASNQAVVSGSISGTQKLVSYLSIHYPKIRTIALQVSAPFHSQYMLPARKKMTPLLEQAPLTSFGKGAIIANVSGKVAKPYTASYLIEQIDQPVMWIQSYHHALTRNVSQLVEIGYGQILSRMWRREPNFSTLDVISSHNITTAIQTLSSTL